MRLVLTVQGSLRAGERLQDFHAWVKRQPPPLDKDAILLELLDEVGRTVRVRYHVRNAAGDLVIVGRGMARSWVQDEELGYIQTDDVVMCLDEPVPQYMLTLFEPIQSESPTTDD